MYKLALTVIAAVVLGCGSMPGDPDGYQHEIGTDEAPTTDSNECASEVVETTLRGQKDVTVVTLCTACDNGCDGEGHPCGRYGDSCTVSGKRGVCGACCDGELGQLRCHPID